MYGKVNLKLADGTEKEFGMLATGTTAYRYKQIFKGELMRYVTKLVNKELDYVGENADCSCVDKLAFIMNCTAEGKDLNKQNFTSFLAFMEQLDSGAIINAMGDIISIYLGNKESTSEPKKEEEQ